MDGQTIPVVLTAILSAAGTSFAAWLKFRGNQSTSAVDVTQQLLEGMTKLQDTITARDRQITDLQKELKALHDEVKSLKKQIEHYESSNVPTDSAQLLEALLNEFPCPMWIHEVGANQWFLNNAYCQRLSVSRQTFWDPINVYRFYSPQIASKFVTHDMKVVESGATQAFREAFPSRIMQPIGPTNPATEWNVVKIPVTAGGKAYVIGICSNHSCHSSLIDLHLGD